MDEEKKLSLIFFVSRDQMPQMKICHMFASEYPEVIEGRSQLIVTDVLDPDEADEDGSIDCNFSALDEEDESCLVEAGVSTGVTEVGKKEVEEVHKAVKYSSLFSYMLKTPSLITQGFKKNKKAQ